MVVNLTLRLLVTPFVGVWIETLFLFYDKLMYTVTPFVGVWIETSAKANDLRAAGSHPSWVCGLKLLLRSILALMICHTLRGCVD